MKRAKLLTTALRSFLHYARYRGGITCDFAAAVPTVANWSKNSTACAIPAEAVRQLSASVNRRTPMGRRDYAILLLLAQVMEPDAAVARTFNAGGSQYLVEGIAKGHDRILPAAWAIEERGLGKVGTEVLDGARAAVTEPRDQVRGKRQHSRFVERGVADMQGASIVIDVGLREPQEFPGPQSDEVQNAQRSAQDNRAHRGCPSR